MKEAVGLWIYRLAFVVLIGICLIFLHFVFQARQLWYPCYEEKLLRQAKQIENSLQPPVNPQSVKKKRLHEKKMRSVPAKRTTYGETQ